ncbi:reverse transcriptase domain-containing protein, partial [Streptomyces chartreusis]
NETVPAPASGPACHDRPSPGDPTQSANTQGPCSYEWVVEGDIKACFDEISHSALMDRVRERVGDKRVLDLVKAFLKAGILDEDGTLVDTNAGTPQGSILSPLLSNVALSALDEHIAQGPGGPGASPYGRAKRRRQGLPNYRLVRYADLCRVRHRSAYAVCRVMPMSSATA